MSEIDRKIADKVLQLGSLTDELRNTNKTIENKHSELELLLKNLEEVKGQILKVQKDFKLQKEKNNNEMIAYNFELNSTKIKSNDLLREISLNEKELSNINDLSMVEGRNLNNLIESVKDGQNRIELLKRNLQELENDIDIKDKKSKKLESKINSLEKEKSILETTILSIENKEKELLKNEQLFEQEKKIFLLKTDKYTRDLEELSLTRNQLKQDEKNLLYRQEKDNKKLVETLDKKIEFEIQIKDLKIKLEKNKQISEKELNVLNKIIIDKRNEKTMLNEEINSSGELIKTLKKDLETIKNDWETTTKKNRIIEETLNKERIQSLQDKKDLVLNKKEFETYKVNLDKELNNKSSELRKLDNQVQIQREAIEKLSCDQLALKEVLSINRKDISEIIKEINNRSTLLQKLDSEIKENRNKIKSERVVHQNWLIETRKRAEDELSGAIDRIDNLEKTKKDLRIVAKRLKKIWEQKSSLPFPKIYHT